MLEDLQHGFRMIARCRGFTAIAVLTLALGIGATTAIFSVVNEVLLDPLPFKDPDQLVCIWTEIPDRDIHFSSTLYSTYREWRQQSTSFAAMSAALLGSANLNIPDEPERVSVMRVNASFFEMLGVEPLIGRNFRVEEDRPGAPRVAIVSHGMWQRGFGADRNLNGKPITLNGITFVVVGVLPPDFRFTVVPASVEPPADIYTPIARTTARGARQPYVVLVYARLKPAVSLERAQQEMNAISLRIGEQFPERKGWGASVWRVRDFMVRDVRRSLLVLFAAVVLLLLIACVNVANLLLEKAASRSKEITMRMALGAGRWRIMRQLLTESTLLAGLGGMGGLLVAYGSVRLVATLGPAQFPMLQEVQIDGQVLLFTMLVVLLTGILFGLAPAIAASRPEVCKTLGDARTSLSESPQHNRFRSAVLVAEVAMTLLLMVGAVLMIRSFLRLQETDPGFGREGILKASINLPQVKYPKPEQRVDFYRQVLERIRGMPGVKVAGMTSSMPLGGRDSAVPMIIEGEVPPRPGDAPIIYFRTVDADYFRAMRIPLIEGRYFGGQETREPLVAIINETMAQRFWPSQNPLGKRFGNGREWYTVIGVVGDVKHTSLAVDTNPEFFQPHLYAAPRAMNLVIQTTSDPMLFAPVLRKLVQEIDEEQPVSRIGSMAQMVADSLESPQFSAILFGVFASVAFVLSAVGIYSVVSFTVARRTGEMAVRMALGARADDVIRMVVGRAIKLALAGIVLGLAGGLSLTRVIRSLVYGVSATDPATYAGVSLVLVGVALVASYIPARRATKVDPMVALRYE